ncbi:hypothetical protein C8034_v008700 [Colletotrichum sidae]|uniref:Uncharacterized protein n=1 Tax=Colletotrichum sidae TaxID=1347389 RepID=A0A4R8T466_9PEZI|nr:hypothetical protein C8034_v008700 [Colletotrichum sidae]
MAEIPSAPEGIAKRSVTPNRPLYTSFDEAHRKIAQAIPKPPCEEDFLPDRSPEQVERMLNEIRPPQNLPAAQVEEHNKIKKLEDTSPTNNSSLKVVNPPSAKSPEIVGDQAYPSSQTFGTPLNPVDFGFDLSPSPFRNVDYIAPLAIPRVKIPAPTPARSYGRDIGQNRSASHSHPDLATSSRSAVEISATASPQYQAIAHDFDAFDLPDETTATSSRPTTGRDSKTTEKSITSSQYYEITSPSSASVAASQGGGSHVDHGLVSPVFEDENAFIDESIYSADEPQDYKQTGNQVAHDTHLAAASDFPETSSFYPEDGTYLNSDDTEDPFVLEEVLQARSSPILVSMPNLPPPVAPSYPRASQTHSHFDDVTKKQAASDHVGPAFSDDQNATSYTSGFQSTTTSSEMPSSSAQETDDGGNKYDADVCQESEGQFVGHQDKGMGSASRLNPFHSASIGSSQESDMGFDFPAPEGSKTFTGPFVEKEISRALHEATGISQPSSALVVGRTRPSRSHALQDSPDQSRPQGSTAAGFYHAPAIQPSQNVTPSGVKVKVSVGGPSPYGDADAMNMRETLPYNYIDSTQMATADIADTNKDAQDGEDDWRTVTEDREHEFPVAAMGRVITGSSIANVSDDLLIAHQSQNFRQTPATRRVPSAQVWWGQNNSSVRPPIPSPLVPFPSLPSPQRVLSRRAQTGYEDIELNDYPTSPPWERFDIQDEARIDRSEFSNLPFAVVPREVAARRQAARRASGLEDQTLSGRESFVRASRGFSNPSSFQPPFPCVRRDSVKSAFSHVDNRNFTIDSLYTPERPYGTSRPRAATDRALASPGSVQAAALERQLGRPLSPRLYNAAVLTNYLGVNAVRSAGGRGTDSELADMAITARDAAAEPALRRQAIFYWAVMGATLVAPMVGFAVLNCGGDAILASLTNGECSGLSYQQRRNLRFMLLAGLALWASAVFAGLVALAALRG